MKYASEHVGVLTSVHQWKPIPPDRFANLLHFYSTNYADLYGHEALHTTALALDRDATATVFYRRKERGSSVSSPVLMTMEGVAGKTLCFETTNPEFAVEPEGAATVIRGAMAARDAYKGARLKAVAQAAAKSGGVVVVIAPRKEDRSDVERAYEAAGGKERWLEFFVATDLGGLSTIRCPVLGVWLHNGDGIGIATLGPVMDRIAELMKGEGWMGMTGNSPMGWPSPKGLPEGRV